MHIACDSSLIKTVDRMCSNVQILIQCQSTLPSFWKEKNRSVDGNHTEQ